MNDNEDHPAASMALGAAIAIGAGVGTALFAGSDNPAWIGIGAGIGVLFGLIWQRRS
jgi:ElaB/YqjD/DUF883 family membrane-anchored ribosome-binding protein